MPDFPDPVALYHPSDPDEIVVMSRFQLPTLALSGWVEAKSPKGEAAPAAVITPEDPSATGDEK